MTLSAKWKLTTTPAQAEQLRRTALAYRDALNYTSQVAYDQGKLSNAVRLQKLVYRELRGRFGLSAQLACTVPRQVAATYKGLWTKVQQHAEHRRRGFTKKRYKGLDRAPKYVAMTTTISYGYDYRFKAEQHVSLTTLDGRLVLPYQGYAPHLASITAGRQFAEEQTVRERQPAPATEEQDRAEPEPERRLDQTNQALLTQAALLWEEEGEQEEEEEEEPVPEPAVEQPSPSRRTEEESTGSTFGAATRWRDPRTKQW